MHECRHTHTHAHNETLPATAIYRDILTCRAFLLQKRKVEGDLKLTQEAVSDLERINSELAQAVQRKEKEVSSRGSSLCWSSGSTVGSRVSALGCRLEPSLACRGLGSRVSALGCRMWRARER